MGGDYGGPELAIFSFGGDYGGPQVAILSFGGDYGVPEAVICFSVWAMTTVGPRWRF